VKGVNKRMMVSFSENAYKTLEELQKATGESKAGILRTAIALLALAEEKKRKNGEGIAIVKNGKIKQEIVIP
jgi:hypothetical protein